MSIESDLKTLFRDIEEVSSLSPDERRAYYRNFRFGPPSLPVGQGRCIYLTDEGAKAVARIARSIRNNSPTIKMAYSEAELLRLTGDLIGRLLLADTAPGGVTFEVPEDAIAFKIKLKASLNEHLSGLRSGVTHIFGCWVVYHHTLLPICIGPVWFGHRETWLNERRADRTFDKATHERIGRHWQGRKLRKRKNRSWSSHYEQDILDTVGPCPWICSVSFGGHAPARSGEKAVLAARIALATIALCWVRPARAACDMGLLIDTGPSNFQTTLCYDAKGFVGSSHINLSRRGAIIFDEDLQTFHSDYHERFDTVGAALHLFLEVQPSGLMGDASARLCRSLTWFWEACNSPLDFMAITKFATSIDVLSEGQGEHAICDLLNRVGDFAPEDKFLKDGTTVKTLAREVYKEGRSKFVHGARPSLIEDLTSPRARAEMLASRALQSYIAWMRDYFSPNSETGFNQVA